MREMTEQELRAAATCGACGKKALASGLPLFWRVRIERWGVKLDAVKRQAGLEMMLGGSVRLAQALSPGEPMAVEVMDPVTLTLCESCVMEKQMIPALAESVSADDR